jgi:hypothetical protein
MQLLVLVGLIALIIGLLFGTQWIRSRCPSCRKTWRETGQVQSAGFMAGRNAYLKEWRCPACGRSEWIKSF